jgi:hypothetical protein
MEAIIKELQERITRIEMQVGLVRLPFEAKETKKTAAKKK